MGRKLIDCRAAPVGGGCTVAISADTEDELMEAAVQHAAAVHHEQDTPELRAYIRKMMQDAGRQDAAAREDPHAA